MKHLRRLCLALTLVCAFTLSAYAGDIECTGITAPVEPPVAGDMHDPVMQALVIMFSLV